MVSAYEKIKPQINADERRFVGSEIQHIFVDYIYGNFAVQLNNHAGEV